MSAAAKEAMLHSYLSALQERGAQFKLTDELSDAGQTVIALAGLGYVWIDVSLDFPGKWKLPLDSVGVFRQRAEKENQAVFYALLIERRDGRGANGYILTDFESTPVKRPIAAEDGQIVIEEKRHLDSLRLILSTEKQADLLLRKRR
jgi:hypothetical protein